MDSAPDAPSTPASRGRSEGWGSTEEHKTPTAAVEAEPAHNTLRALLYNGLSDGIANASQSRIETLLFSPTKPQITPRGKSDELPVPDEVQQRSKEAILSSFDVSAFVAEGLETFSLPQLRDVLSSELEARRGELSAAINTNYASFVNLSTQLEGFDSALMRLATPLQEAARNLDAVKELVSSEKLEREGLQQKISASKQLQQALSLYCDISEALERIHTLSTQVGVLSPSSFASKPSLQKTSLACFRAANLLKATENNSNAALATIDAVLSEVSKLGPSGESGGEVQGQPPSVLFRAKDVRRSLGEQQTKLQGLQEQLQSKVITVFGTWLQALIDDGAAVSVHRAELRQVLHAVSLLSSSALCQDAVVTTLLLPHLSKTLTQAALDDGVRGSSKGVDKLFHNLASWALPSHPISATSPASATATPSTPFATLLEASQALPGFDLLTVLWTTLVAFLLGQPYATVARAQSVATAPGSTPAVSAAAGANLLPGIAPGHAFAAQFFSPAHPQSFRANYSAVSTFFSRLRVIGSQISVIGPDMQVLTASRTLGSAPASLVMATAWKSKLAAYFGIRTADITSRVEKALELKVSAVEFVLPASMDLSALPQSVVHLNAADVLADVSSEWRTPLAVSCLRLLTNAEDQALLEWLSSSRHDTFIFTGKSVPGIVSAAQSIWSPQQFLSPLYNESVTYFLGLLGRVGAWVLSGACAAASKIEFEHELHAQLSDASSTYMSVPKGWAEFAMKTSKEAAFAAAWSDASPDLLLSVCHDVFEFIAFTSEVIGPRIRSLAGTAPGKPDEPDAVAEALGPALVSLTHATRHLQNVACQSMIKSITTAIGAAVRGVPNAHRMGSSRALPTSSSAYVQTAFRSLRSALQKSPGDSTHASRHALLPTTAPFTPSFVEAVGMTAFTAFDDAVASVLSNTAQMEVSLQWLRRAQTGEGASTVSDSDKIGSQLFLDLLGLAENFTSVVNTAGVSSVGSPSDFPPFEQTMERLHQYQGQQQAGVPGPMSFLAGPAASPGLGSPS